MDLGLITEINKEAIYLLIMISAPILLIALIVGVVVSLLQALTQIQENTLTFVPKIFSVYFSLIIFLPYMYSKLRVFVDHIVQLIIK